MEISAALWVLWIGKDFSTFMLHENLGKLCVLFFFLFYCQLDA